WTGIYNNQNLAKRHNFNFLRFDIECSGVLPYVTNHNVLPMLGLQQSDNLFGNTYSHYLLADIDWRHYFVRNKDEQFVTRVLVGAGTPILGSTQELPFDKSFWAGGSNDIRAWLARTLGPGGNNQPYVVDQIGDIKMEMNLEYRVSLIKILGLGLFVDAGNIWLLNNNPSVPNGNFLLNGPNVFYNQIAIAYGMGLRFDFTY